MDDAPSVDYQTLGYIKEFLQPSRIEQEKLHKLSSKLIRRDIYEDQKKNDHKRITLLEAELEEYKRPSSQTEVKTVFGTCQGNGSSDCQIAFQQLQEDNQELEAMVARNEETELKHRKEYDNLNEMLNHAYDELEDSKDKCYLYRSMVHQLTDNLSQNEQNRASAEVKRQLQEQEQDTFNMQDEFRIEQTMEQTKDALEEVSQQLKSAEVELQELVNNENHLKKELNLPHTASDKQVRDKVQQLMRTETGRIHEVNRISRELRNVRQQKKQLGERVKVLEREKQNLEFQYRQTKHSYHRVAKEKRHVPAIIPQQRNLESNPTHVKSSARTRQMAQHKPSDLSNVKTAATQLSSSKPPLVSLHSSFSFGDPLYCLLCHREFDIDREPTCTNHYRAFRSGRWGCCDKGRGSEQGCVSLPHLYLLWFDEGKLFLTTNGTNSIRMK